MTIWQKFLGSSPKIFQLIIVVLFCSLKIVQCGVIEDLSVPKPKLAQVKVLKSLLSQLGDAPYWDREHNDLYYVDAFEGQACRLNVVSDVEVRINLWKDLSHISPLKDEPGYFLVTRLGELLKLHWNTHTYEVVASLTGGKRPEQFSNAKRDPRGRLFVGSVILDFLGVAIEKGGSLYRLDEENNEFTLIRHGFTISNGMVWSNDVNHTKFYFVDTGEKSIFVFDYDIETGTPSNPQVLWQGSDPIEAPDGIVLDDEGFLWVCMYAGGRLIKIDAETGLMVDQVTLETAHVPTSLARGPYEGVDGYYVTTAKNYLVPRPDDGRILHISFPEEGKA